ncbi:MAG: DUF192 domain-containing protein [Nitrosomonas ureae]
MSKKLAWHSVAMACGLLLSSHAIAQDSAQSRLPTVELTAGMHVIQAEVARTYDQQSTGLMYRRKMGINEGMLFVYEVPQIRCYWMRNTHIPLTIAFIDDEGVIVNLRDMQSRSEHSHCSTKPVRYALEMNQGWFKARGLKPGFKLHGIPLAPVVIP